jgi:hypothetical protein
VGSQPPEQPARRSAPGHLVVSNWIWLLIVLALIGVVVWGWVWDFGR